MTFEEDDFSFEKPRWLAVLSNGKTVIMDENRPGLEPSAWLRLKKYVEKTGLNIVELKLQFRSHHESPLPKNAQGYFFSHMAGSEWGGETYQFFNIGHVENGKLYVQKWTVPALIHERGLDDVREPESEGIIWNKKI